MHRYLQLAIGLILLFGLGSSAAIYLLEWEHVHKDVGYSAEARQDPFLTARSWLKRHDIEMVDGHEPQLLHKLPPAAGMLLLDANQQLLHSDDVDRLLAWVESGGHLMISLSNRWGVAYPTGPLLQRLGVAIVEPVNASASGSCSPRTSREIYRTDKSDEPEQSSEPMPFAVQPLMSKPEEVKKPEEPEEPDLMLSYPLVDGSVARVEMDDDYFLRIEGGEWPMQLRNDGGLQWVGRTQGKGRIEVVTQLYFWHNWNITDHDHGWLLARLAGAGPVWYLQLEEYPSLLTLLWQRMPELLLAMLLWLLLWGWYSSRRFGPLLPPPDSERREWLEHIEACARQLWRRGYGVTLLRRMTADDDTALQKQLHRIAGDDAAAARMLATALKNEQAFVRLAAALSHGQRSDAAAGGSDTAKATVAAEAIVLTR
ncbi:MAG: hypothetical protein CO186_04670 [Zetaproteobacteria bacterium CG_4_9_14_3_um_filter_49_83]|nr:MAG: hypothetical protein AUJ56_00665 [Zetaproteobacteria bacterium CG1_02_49_23]PIQ31502.1 MAG: hypothetical protein COW62_09555 [Zetaproteobacteria bacterium CG17_big_fil_post_rev_8_21_14_2_50_50_13]PIY54619.1 MAG: hypothetical protein COZ00_13810 [Zetaproteobacteria bacterium CG_4_10_14_0_8_um_filter_49_80]PJA35651.1 MAG: hypothetical protein CO186_04670 [Zetaproteobacteria bacterium CG_4_9_14_3_um_filter_49_83]